MKRYVVAVCLALVAACSSDTAPPVAPIESSEPVVSAQPPDGCPAGHVRLTFDDGPNPEVTPRILDTLESYSATATFFVLGRFVEMYPDLVKRAHDAGHRIENHTYTHPRLPELPPDAIAAEFDRTSAVIKQVTGTPPSEWRPPFEEHTPEVRQVAESRGLTMVLWNYETDTKDWQRPSGEVMRDRVVSNAKDGSVILAHDTYAHTAGALPSILEGLYAKGLCTM